MSVLQTNVKTFFFYVSAKMLTDILGFSLMKRLDLHKKQAVIILKVKDNSKV